MITNDKTINDRLLFSLSNSDDVGNKNKSNTKCRKNE